MDQTPSGKDISVGFRKYKILEKIGVMAKVESQDHFVLGKGSCKWAIIERN